MSVPFLRHIEAIAFALYLRIKDARVDLEKAIEVAQEEKKKKRGRLIVLRGGKRD